MPKIVPFARDNVAVFAALVGFTVLAVPFDSALGQSEVTVVNPTTNPVPTSVRNPATMSALTSSIDDPGRAAYQSARDCPPAPGCPANFLSQAYRWAIGSSFNISLAQFTQQT